MELLVLLVSCFSLIPFSCSQLSLPNINFINYNPMELTEKLPGYGKTWMYFPNGMGIPIIAQLEFKNLIPELYSPTEKFVTFHLYTRLNSNVSQIIELGNQSTVTESNFNVSKSTKFIIHGWTSSYESDTSQKIKDNFLEVDDLNIILVDWHKIASNPIYPISAMETKNVGDVTARMVDFLVQNGVNLKDIHVIGHSLGAHVAGRTGHSVKSGNITRVTGLDPAFPGFEFIASNENKLDKSDAEFVDIIHTCGGVLGYYSKLGHVDFYPNGGVPSQPGCFGLPQIIEACSHGRSWKYFAESILNTQGFMSTSCDSWTMYNKGGCTNNTRIPMGIAAKKIDGVYFLKTEESKGSIMNNAITGTKDSILEVSEYLPIIG